MRYVVSCRTCRSRWVDGDDLDTHQVAVACPCPPALELWDVTRAPSPLEARLALDVARYELGSCAVPGGCPACQVGVLLAIETAALAVHAYTPGRLP